MSGIEGGIALISGAFASIRPVSGLALPRGQHVHLWVRKGEAAFSDRGLPILRIPVSAELWSK